MIVDSTLLFEGGGNELTSVASGDDGTLIGDVIDLGTVAAARRIGSGQPVYVNITFEEDVAPATAAVTFEVRCGSNAGLTSSDEAVGVSHSITGASKGDKVSIALSASDPTAFDRYMGVRVLRGTTAVTSLQISAALVNEQHIWYPAPDWRG